ncbi:hypothetical protein M153_1000130816 [Pseudoloma neurophilia]|uniref:Uncharacterized protein n=1 Tax=Pseudoloma neurophilia TaxID=146866 RepID=A0A0R0M5F1_9MICR|nr:hypothetical protein M153_1000130816 [Pseudoloma neurophilia]
MIHRTPRNQTTVKIVIFSISKPHFNILFKLKMSKNFDFKSICPFNPYSLFPPHPSDAFEITKRTQPENCPLGNVDEIVHIRDRIFDELVEAKIKEIYEQLVEHLKKTGLDQTEPYFSILGNIDQHTVPQNTNEIIRECDELFHCKPTDPIVQELRMSYLKNRLVGKQGRLQDRVFRGFTEQHQLGRISISPLYLPEIRMISNFSESYVLNEIKNTYNEKLEYIAIQKRNHLQRMFEENYRIWAVENGTLSPFTPRKEGNLTSIETKDDFTIKRSKIVQEMAEEKQNEPEITLTNHEVPYIVKESEKNTDGASTAIKDIEKGQNRASFENNSENVSKDKNHEEMNSKKSEHIDHDENRKIKRLHRER